MIGFPLDSHVSFDTDGTPILDRAITSAPLRELIKKIMTDGVLPNPSTNLQVTAGSGMTLTVKAGFCIVNGCMKLVEADESVTLDAGEVLPRIDSVVMRLDDNDNVRSCELFVLKGTSSASPVPANLVRSGSIYDICLAEVSVGANVSAISESAINDTRYNTEKCGIISAIAEFDTTTLYNQIQSDLNEFKLVNEEDFKDWFSNIREILDKDVAGHLQNEIDETNSNVGNLTQLQTQDKSNLVNAINEVLNSTDESIYEKVDGIIGTDEAWSETKSYAVGDMVLHNNKLWQSKIQHSGQEPPNSTYWENVSLSQLSNNFGTLRFGVNGDSGEYGYYKADDSFVPFKSFKFNSTLLGSKKFTSSSTQTIPIKNINEYEFIVISLVPVQNGYFISTSSNLSILMVISVSDFKNIKNFSPVSGGGGGNMTYTIKYINDTTFTVQKTGEVERTVYMYGIK